MPLYLIVRILACSFLLLQTHVSFASNICSAADSQKIGDFSLSESRDGSDSIWATTPYPRDADWRASQSKLRQEFDGSARQAIAKYLYPNASEVSFTMSGMETWVKTCPQGKLLVYQQPRSGIKEVRVLNDGNSNGSGMRANDLFDATKSFSTEKLLSPISGY